MCLCLPQGLGANVSNVALSYHVCVWPMAAAPVAAACQSRDMRANTRALERRAPNVVRRCAEALSLARFVSASPFPVLERRAEKRVV